MTVTDLQFELLRLGFDVPMDALTVIWTKRMVKKAHKYVLWRLADHRGPGMPMVEPEILRPYKMYKPPRRVEFLAEPVVCWSLSQSSREIK